MDFFGSASTTKLSESLGSGYWKYIQGSWCYGWAAGDDVTSALLEPIPDGVVPPSLIRCKTIRLLDAEQTDRARISRSA